ncbi:pentatricopeptide repeat-containing protein At2g13600-like [Selaginella moellendorffii]|uniref:pentatricopeptide repeat-containing protein At2g13600-like n=1 Tax=Selaginella moellendorffii TaxID=88036 RepID=UPI000D1CFDC9|nr:pentatricopeptide repeat-containing protein At2g13600-like [Selaginella moellendorffii]|eukprot:XP_024543939.1 pentatricopeptide repeat-containing protein At2g13600-like [Selaginella moellendorffii]
MDDRGMFCSVPVVAESLCGALSLAPTGCNSPVSRQASNANLVTHDATHIESVHASLKACIRTKDLQWGKVIHSQGAILLSRNVNLANSLITMYCKCGSLDDARSVFDGMLLRDVVSWNALMQGYVDAGQGGKALEIFSRMMEDSGCDPDARSFVAAIKACSSELQEGESSTDSDGKKLSIRGKALDRGRWIHSQAAKFGCESNMFVSSSLIDFYAKCGRLVDARRVFSRMRVRDVVTWNAIILGHAENEEPELALEFFSSMQREGSVPNSRTFVAAIKACAVLAEFESSTRVEKSDVKVASLERGMALHSQAERSGSVSDVFVRNILVDMYAKCGDVEDSRHVFDRSSHRDVVSWNALILGYADNGEEHLALGLFSSMPKPNSRSYVAALKACSALAAKEQGKEFDGKAGIKIDSLEKGMALHAGAAISGCELDHFVANTLVDMYVKCGSTEDGRRVFEKIPHRSAVSWSALILGYANNRQGKLGLELFLQEMEKTPGLTPNAQAFNSVLKACASVANLRSSKFFHGEICKSGCESIPALGTSLVDSYGKCGSSSEAQRVFDLLARNDVDAGRRNSSK